MSTNLFGKDRLLNTGDVAIKAMGASMLMGLPFMVTGNVMFLGAGLTDGSVRMILGTGGSLVLLGGGIAQLTILIMTLQAGLA